MKPIFLCGALRVEYRVRTRALAQGVFSIENETRAVGGDGALAALALVRLGARVRLVCNALGDDAHGRFLRRELEGIENLQVEWREGADATPYAILLRGEAGETQTLLSPSAQHLKVAGQELSPGSQSYAGLLSALRRQLEQGLRALEPEFSIEERRVQVEEWLRAYDATFGEWLFADN